MSRILFPGAYVSTRAVFAATVVAVICGRLSAAIIYESALPIEPEPGLQSGIVIGGSPGNQIYGAAFSIQQTVQVQAIGGFFFGPSAFPNDVFGAIVRLPSIDGFPSGNPLNESEVVAHTVFDVGKGEAHEITVPLAATLEPGAYALVFGNDHFGAEGFAAAPESAGSLNTRYVFWNTTVPAWGRGTWNARFLVLGTIPEPSTALLVAAAICRLWILRGRLRRF